MSEKLFKIDPIALEKIRTAPTLEEAGEHWSDSVAVVVKEAFHNETLRNQMIPAAARLLGKIPLIGKLIIGFADDIIDVVGRAVVEAFDAIDGEDDVQY